MSTSTLSNLYVEKASSEHPLGLWILNEQVDYVSQITETQRQLQLFASWELENAEAIAEPSSSVNAPFQDSSTSRIIGAIPATTTSNIVARSKFNLSQNLVPELTNFSIGFYVFIDTALANTVSFGYQYVDPDTEQVVEVLNTETIKKSDKDKWKFYSSTFDIPSADFEDVKLLIKFNVSQGGVAGDYDLLINGLSVGQWSEDFNKVSYGVSPQPIPSNIALPTSLKVMEAFPYGASGESGYYLSQGYALSAINFGVPLVYGSSNVTKLFPNKMGNDYQPSLIFPGYGFLNKRGQNNTYTVEMWLRINSSSSQTRRIFGPIAGTDGLYTDGAYLSLKVGKSYGSHYVGEWFRPMLIHIRMSGNSAIVILNGEEVINIEYDDSTISFPQEIANNGKSQDWLGFYAYEDVSPIDIDTFSIYSYSMPTEVAKRRWVWGQAVPSPEQTNSSINSITAFNDYAFAGYAANYNYPDFANWKQAFYSNVTAGDKSLSLPDYQLPSFNLGQKQRQQLFDDIRAIERNSEDIDDQSNKQYMTLYPNNTWTDDSSSIYFETFGMLTEPVKSFYGIFKTDGTEVNKPLIKITNKTNKDYVLIALNQNEVKYSIRISGIITVLETKTITANKKFNVGLDIQKLSGLPVTGINKFFSDQSVLDAFIAGDGFTKFNGKIYKVGFDANYNNRKISALYDSRGIAKLDIQYTITNVTTNDGQITYKTSTKHQLKVGDIVTVSGVVSTSSGVFNLSNQTITSVTSDTFTIENAATGTYTSGGIVSDNANISYGHFANYTLTTIDKYGITFPDIAVAGYWEDYMPLTYFGKRIIDFDGNYNYELDSIQFNQDYPEPPANLAEQTTSQWTYSDLAIEYSIPQILTYADLNNAFYTQWENYLEMSQRSIKTNFYDTNNEVLKSYVSFQYVSDGANKNLLDFENYARPLASGIIDPAATDIPWETTAFEATTGIIIYPPTQTSQNRSKINFEKLAIVYHLDFRSDGILHHPIRFKELQLASQVFERTDFTPVGSRFGIPVYYYTKEGIYYNLKAKNPVVTYKKSTPHLYLNRQSGWKIKGEFSTLQDRGLAIPINLPEAADTKVSSIQMWVRFADRDVPADPVMIFSIEHNGGTYDFFIDGDSSGKRGIIFGVDRDSSEVLDEVRYFVNGQSVFTPFINKDEWAVIGLEFPDLLDFSLRSGRLNLNGPLTYNNISYNLATNIEKDETLETRSWNTIKLIGTWGDVPEELEVIDNSDPPYVWQQVKIINQSIIYTIDPQAIYQKYTGSNRVIVDDESNGVLINPERIKVYGDISWTNTTKIAV